MPIVVIITATVANSKRTTLRQRRGAGPPGVVAIIFASRKIPRLFGERNAVIVPKTSRTSIANNEITATKMPRRLTRSDASSARQKHSNASVARTVESRMRQVRTPKPPADGGKRITRNTKRGIPPAKRCNAGNNSTTGMAAKAARNHVNRRPNATVLTQLARSPARGARILNARRAL
jgi:hypothetical protein